MAPRLGSKMRKYNDVENLFLVVMYSSCHKSWKETAECFNEEFSANTNYITLRKHWSNMCWFHPVYVQLNHHGDAPHELQNFFEEITGKYARGDKLTLPPFGANKEGMPSPHPQVPGSGAYYLENRAPILSDDQIRWVVIIRCWCYPGKKNWKDTTKLFNEEFETHIKVGSLQRAFKCCRTRDALYCRLQDAHGKVSAELADEVEQYAKDHGWVPRLKFIMGTEAAVKVEYVKEEASACYDSSPISEKDYYIKKRTKVLLSPHHLTGEVRASRETESSWTGALMGSDPPGYVPWMDPWPMWSLFL
ncbi:MAG: hypothetical protein M4579_001140 [Chaenotheca gracillima]|nr:MAG: hypothetical protein M4579_001140 [Chaenotheca gracillima]